MRKSTLQIIILAGIVALFAGCAVLTVDVDVYKGSLANHKDVQTEQMAAMAIGAKPLLVQLRDTLEAKGPKGDSSTHPADWREDKEVKCWYKPAYIGPAPGQTRSRFKNQNADRVNDVLSLYEDLEDEQYSLFVRRANQALKDYSVAYMILKPESPLEDEKVWKKIGLKKDGFRKEVESLVKGEPNSTIEEELYENIKELHKNYKDFCTKNKYRNARALLTTWHTIRCQLTKLKINLPEFKLLQNDALLNKFEKKEFESSSNAAFRALAQTSLADFQAKYLFGLKGKKRERFVNHVKEISLAFLDARDALDCLLQVELETIIWLSNQREEYVSCYDQRINEIARAATEIIQSQHVAFIFNVLNKNDTCVPDGLEPMLNALEGTRNYLEVWEPPNYDVAKKKLLSELINQPAKTAKRLLDGHKYSKNILKEDTLKVKLREAKLREAKLKVAKPEKAKPKVAKTKEPEDYHIWYISGWDYGFTRGPFAKVSPITIHSLSGLVRKAFPSGVFAKGRLDKGLETLIEEYLKLASNCNADEDEVECARKRLSDALVRFAEKVLFIANNDVLLNDPTRKDIGLIRGAADVGTRAALGFPLKPPDLTTRYTRILQAVGNSILVQVDALRQEETYDQKQKGRVKSEIVAINRTLNQPPSRVIDQLLEELKAKLSAKERELKQAERKLKKVKQRLKEAQKEWNDPDNCQEAKAEAGKKVKQEEKNKEVAEKLINEITPAKTKLEDAIAGIKGVKYDVLREADKMDGVISAKVVHGLLGLTLNKSLSTKEEELAKDPDNGNIKNAITRLKSAIDVFRKLPQPMEPIVVDKCMLGDKDKATAKDVRDVWITLLGYEHDLALRNGQIERAGEIALALEAARKKREGMIFIRPAMAYLRTSFPSTSLQDNPNLTWDNMLGVHATRSIPFAPQLGELFNPDAKRDAMITAEIDKQFWQNINRVRVAGGGNTNYVVAKDDIGNWYVKGYSADQKDIINSAKNLAMFSLSAKIPAGSPEIDVEEPDVEDTPLGGLFAKHKKNYDTQTEADLGVLRKIFEDNQTKIDAQIKSVWKQNKAISPNDKLPTSLKEQLCKASDRHLKPFREKIKQKDKETQQAGLIIEGLDALRQFGGSLITAIKNLNLNNEQDVEVAAVGAVRDIVRREIMELVKRRKRAVEDYEMAISFIGDAVAD